MKAKTLFAFFFALAVTAMSVAYAQTTTPAVSRPAAANTAAPASAPTAAGVAVVYTELFVDPKNGIQRLVNAAGSVDREFQPRSTELQNLQRQIETATTELQKKASVQAPEATRTETERIERLDKEFKRKAEDAQADYARRRNEVLSPLSESINTALQAFARGRGVAMLIDGSKFQGGMMVLNDSVDITNEFIADYNRRNPATAAAATPPAARPATATRP